MEKNCVCQSQREGVSVICQWGKKKKAIYWGVTSQRRARAALLLFVRSKKRLFCLGAPVIRLERATCGPRPGASTRGSPETAGWREIKGREGGRGKKLQSREREMGEKRKLAEEERGR